MTIPLIKCQNLTTGEVCTIPAEKGYPVEVYQFMNDALRQKEKIYRHGGLDFCVHESENFKYCALLNEIRSDDKGKRSIITYTKDDVVQYCRAIERFAEENFNEFISYAHDIQYMIGTFVHKSRVNQSNQNDIDKLRTALLEINTLSAIISAKDCFFRWRTSSFSERTYSVDVVGKFFKIYKAFERFGEVTKKSLTLDFDADSNIPQIETFEVFDFIPYLLVENAVKYAPQDSTIDIEVRKRGKLILATVGSYGPTLKADEKHRIFDKNFRGESAIETGIKGQGLGLYHLKQALSEMKIGSVSVRQKNPVEINGGLQAYTEFELSLTTQP